MRIFYLLFILLFPFWRVVSQEVARLEWGNNQQVLEFVRPYLPEDPIIVEAGAYDGRESVHIAKCWPKGKVYSFEPVPELFEKVKANIQSQPNVKCFKKALSNKDGAATIYLSVEQSDPSHVSCSSSLLAPKEHLTYANYVKFPGTTTVETTSLDSWANQEKIDHVDFLWLDMQGTELDMLKASALAKNAKAIWIEIEFVEAYAGQPLYKDIKAWMNDNGFKLVASNVDVNTPSMWFGDALFVKEETQSNKKNAAITYGFSGGRFGDNLIAFSHAAWLAYTMDMPLVYRPFPYSNRLQMDIDSSLQREAKYEHYDQKQLLTAADCQSFLTEMQPSITQKEVLYILRYFPESAYEYDQNAGLAQHIKVDWEDPGFKTFLKKMISPIKAGPRKNMDPTRITVALHVRKGGGFDPQGWELSSALKAPPDSFYDSALNMLSAILKKPLYVFIFTDDQQPKEIQKRFENKFKDTDIIFSTDQAPKDPIDDFFAFEGFDYMIRPDSNYSVMASHLFPYKGIIFPSHYTRPSKDTVHIDRIKMKLTPGAGLARNSLEFELRDEQ